MPLTLSRVHQRFRTPYIAIIIFSLIAILMLTPGFFATGFFADLGSLYVFGSLLCFALAHASILSLRVRKPDLPRPFKVGGNIRFKGHELPITAILGLMATVAIWLVVIFLQPFSRNLGFAWMLIGILIYIIYRRRANLPIIGKRE